MTAVAANRSFCGIFEVVKKQHTFRMLLVFNVVHKSKSIKYEVLRLGGQTMKIGYARVSTDDQKMDLQRDALTSAGCEKVFNDTDSGAKAERPENVPP